MSQALSAAVSAARLDPDGAVRHGRTRLAPPPGAPSGWAVAALTRLLYRRSYLGRPDDGPSAGAPAATGPVDLRPAFAREDAELGAALRAADGGRWTWQSGWQPSTTDGRLLTDRHGLCLRTTPDEVRTGPAGDVEVRFPTARPFASPGFFLVTGAAGAAGSTEVLRWYLNVAPAAAPQVLEAVVSRFDRHGIPFTFKVLNHPEQFPRPDAAVLYASRSQLELAHRTVLSLHAAHHAHFGTAVPLFTRKVRHGIGVAEEPPPSRVPVSFGQHRCALVAQGIVAAGPAADAATRFAAVTATFAEAGISLEAPHLNPGSAELRLPGGDLTWAA